MSHFIHTTNKVAQIIKLDTPKTPDFPFPKKANVYNHNDPGPTGENQHGTVIRVGPISIAHTMLSCQAVFSKKENWKNKNANVYFMLSYGLREFTFHTAHFSVHLM